MKTSWMVKTPFVVFSKSLSHNTKLRMTMVVWVKTIVRAGGVIYRVYPVWNAETKMLTCEAL